MQVHSTGVVHPRPDLDGAVLGVVGPQREVQQAGGVDLGGWYPNGLARRLEHHQSFGEFAELVDVAAESNLKPDY